MRPTGLKLVFMREYSHDGHRFTSGRETRDSDFAMLSAFHYGRTRSNETD